VLLIGIEKGGGAVQIISKICVGLNRLGEQFAALQVVYQLLHSGNPSENSYEAAESDQAAKPPVQRPYTTLLGCAHASPPKEHCATDQRADAICRHLSVKK
jgi:hypothetical protein